MTTNADDRIDDHTPRTTDDQTISVTSLGEAEQVPAGHARDEQSRDDQFREQPLQQGGYPDEQFRAEDVTDERGPLADDGEPIFPPDPGEDGRSQPGGATAVDPAQLVDDAPGQHRDSDDVYVPQTSAASTEGQDAGFSQHQEQGQVIGTVLPQTADTGFETGYDQTDGGANDPVGASSSVPAPEAAPVAESARPSAPVDDAWLALQGRFVDDPAQAVQEAADRVEKQLAEIRSGLSSADTEGLRTAFRRYRELSDSLR